MPKERNDRIGLLVIRAFVEESPGRRLVVEVLDVDPPGPDRVIGIVDSSAAAARLVADWLDSLEADEAGSGRAPAPSADDDR